MKIEFNTDNDAFKEPYTGKDNEHAFWCEYTRIIARINDQVASGMKGGVIIDINGNKIGKWSL
jgi:hypothetical protein